MRIEMSDGLQRDISGDGKPDAPILFVLDNPFRVDSTSGRPFTNYAGRLYLSQFLKSGILRREIRIECICEKIIPSEIFYTLPMSERVAWKEDFLKRLDDLSPKIIVPLGEEALTLFTGKKSTSKWHLSILPPLDQFKDKCEKVIPLLRPDFVMKKFPNVAYIAFGADRIREEMQVKGITETERNFIVRPTVEQSLDWISDSLKKADELSLDIETGAGQIVCVGASYDPKEAICFPSLPKDFDSPEDYHRIWKGIAQLFESTIPKIGQNFLYDTTYLSAYGIRTRNVAFDTMQAMRFLHPELSKGLDNCARIYSREAYWKDEGKDWGAKQNIEQLYIYNCKDAAVTLEIARAQRADLRQRGKFETFERLAMRYYAPAAEMAWNGLPLRIETLERLKKETLAEIEKWNAVIEEESGKILGKGINPRSPAQVKHYLKSCGFRIPMKQGKETSDYKALLKLRLKSPNHRGLEALIKLSKLNKRYSSYLNFRYDEKTNHLPFSLYVLSTETGRWSSGTDPWDRGLNAQTIPKEVKEIFGYDR